MDIIQSLLLFLLVPPPAQVTHETLGPRAFNSQVTLALLITDAFVLITDTYHRMDGYTVVKVDGDRHSQKVA